MRTLLNIIIFAAIGVLIVVSCKSSDKSNKEQENTTTIKQAEASPPVIIYKTKKDYYENVPLVLTDDGKEITSYPSPRDIYYKGKLAYPDRLSDDFLLDNRGIDKNVAFLDYTYEEYAKLETTPSVGILKKHIIDKDPIVAMYKCGSRSNYNNIIEELNKIIESDDLENCERVD